MPEVETTTSPAIHRPAGQGEALWAMGSLFEVKLAEQDTGGALTAMPTHGLQVLGPPLPA